MPLCYLTVIVLMLAIMVRLIGFIALPKCAGIAFFSDVLSYGILIGGVLLAGMAINDDTATPWCITLACLATGDAALFYGLSCKPREV